MRTGQDKCSKPLTLLSYAFICQRVDNFECEARNPPGSAVVERVDEHQRQGTSEASGQNVHAELLVLRGILGGLEDGLDGILEGEVEGLRGEVSENVGQVT